MSHRKLRIVIIGAGPGGLCMGKRLLDKGFKDFVILERAKDVGGTWYANRYPGCECNTPGILYSFSFEPNGKWSKIYPTQPEILAYLRNIADKYDLRSHCKFGHPVTDTIWNEKTASWKLILGSGDTIEADVVISAVGMFNKPRWPDIEDLDTFKGTIMHTAEWQSDHNFSTDRVAVIGSGDSAVQLVPELVKMARQVHLFQRTPDYVVPKQDKPDSPKQYKATLADPKLYSEFRASMEHIINTFVDRNNPIYQDAFENEGIDAINVVLDPEIRHKLRPKHSFGPRRSFFSNVYYEAFNKTNMNLVTEQITRVTEHGILTNDNVEHQVDTIIIATGFETPKFLSAMNVKGRGGQNIDDAWQDDPLAYLGIMTAGFPNLFMIFGPNTYTGSVPIMIEAEVDYILVHLHQLANEGIESVDVTTEAMLRYDNQVQAAFRSVPEWKIDTISSSRLWKSINVRIWPFTIERYRWLTAKIDPKAFVTTKISKKKIE